MYIQQYTGSAPKTKRVGLGEEFIQIEEYAGGKKFGRTKEGSLVPITDDKTASVASPASSSSTFTNVATGVAALLAPLATAGVGIYQTQLQAKLAKAQLKAQAQQQPAFNIPYLPPPPTSGGSGVLIAVLVGGFVFMGIVMFLVLKSGGSSAGTAATASSSGPQIKRVKRVSTKKTKK